MGGLNVAGNGRIGKKLLDELAERHPAVHTCTTYICEGGFDMLNKRIRRHG